MEKWERQWWIVMKRHGHNISLRDYEEWIKSMRKYR
jgi:hypothetical protein